MPTPSETIETNLAQPKRAKGDGIEVEQHSLPDQIAADKHLSAKAAASRTGFPVRRMLAKAPGATS